jgi:hypothetical protein
MPLHVKLAQHSIEHDVVHWYVRLAHVFWTRQYMVQPLPSHRIAPPWQLPPTLQSIVQPLDIEQSMPPVQADAELQLIWHTRPAGQLTGPPTVLITHTPAMHVPPAAAQAIMHADCPSIIVDCPSPTAFPSPAARPSPPLGPPAPSPCTSNPIRPHATSHPTKASARINRATPRSLLRSLLLAYMFGEVRLAQTCSVRDPLTSPAMARSRRSTPARSKSRSKKKRSSRAKRDPEEALFEQAMLDMIEVMSCPVLVAEDQAERCAHMLLDAEQGRDLAVIAQSLHVDQSAVPVAPLLVELAMTLERHAAELTGLCDRFIALSDHEVSHAHIEPDLDIVKRLALAMFGEPSSEMH